MPTITEQLTQLESDRQDLVDNLETKGITGLSGDETFTELVPEVLNIPSGGDISDYFVSALIPSSHSGENGISKSLKTIPDNMALQSGTTSLVRFFQYCSNLTSVPLFDTSNIVNMSMMFLECYELTTVPQFDTSNVTSMNEMFNHCTKLTTVPLFNTTNVTTMSYMFKSCTSLTTVPLFDTSSVTNFSNAFNSCPSLSNDSLNNILAMCTNATSYTGTKTLATLGLSQTQRNKCTQLSNYQAFLDAGWTI